MMNIRKTIAITSFVLLTILVCNVNAEKAIPEDRITASSASTWVNTPASLTKDYSGLDELLRHDTDYYAMWMSNNDGVSNPNPGTVTGPEWIRYDFDDVYDLTQMWVWNRNFPNETPRGLRMATIQYSTTGGPDPAEWQTLSGWVNGLTGWAEFAIAPGSADYVHNSEVDFGGVAAKHVVITPASNSFGSWGGDGYYGLSEVMFFYNSEKASIPTPINNSTGVNENTKLSWVSGDLAASHNLYFGTDLNDVSNRETSVFIGNLDTNSYDPCGLDLDTTYYWCVDGVNGPTVWPGNVWTFRTRVPFRDLYADTWVATDGVGRELSGYEECGEPRDDKIAAIFYV
ncbi:MAG: hypothetical protein DRI61_17675, partial [Chloroflexi bacterium]